MRRLWLFFSCLLCFARLSAQEHGAPFIRNYTPHDYNSNLQNWAIAQDKRGVMYFGNNQGVLEYDGVQWRLIPVSNRSIVRSLAVNDSGRVYVGAVNQFGYLAPDSQGTLQYVSLSDQLPEAARNFLDVRGTVILGDEVYFHASFHLFRVKNGQIKTWKLSNSYHRHFAVHGKIYLREEGKGLMVLEGEELRMIKNSEIFASETISAMMPYGKKQVLIGSRSKGLFVYDPEKSLIREFSSPVNELLRKSLIYTGCVFPPHNTFIFGTIQQGIFEVDMEGKLVSQQSKQTGLQSDVVYAVLPDNQNILWLALANGIARLELASPLRNWGKISGLEASVLSMERYHGRIYAGTQEGFFSMNENGRFGLVSALGTGQIWKIVHCPKADQLLLATTDGLYRFDGKNISLIKKIRSFSLLIPETDPSTLYVGTNGHVLEFSYRNGNWMEKRDLPVFADEFRTIVQDKAGNLWLGSVYSGVVRIDKSFTAMPTGTKPLLTHYDTTRGLPSMNWNHVFAFDGEVFITTQKGVYRHDAAKDVMQPDVAIQKAFAKAAGNNAAATWRWMYTLSQDAHGNLWFDSDKGKGILLRHSAAEYEVFDTPFRRIVTPPENQVNIFIENKTTGWFGTPDGLVRYDARRTKYEYSVFNTLIRRIRLRDSLLFDGTFENVKAIQANAKMRPAFSYDWNAVTFEYAAAAFEDEKTNEYSYRLEGYDKQWSPWSKETYKEYTYLSEGSYTFKVKARNLYGTESRETAYAFKIYPPWYRRTIAYVTYIVLSGFLIWGVVRLNSRRLEKRNQVLADIVLERTAEIMQQKEEIEAQRDDILTKNAEIGQAYEELSIQKTQTETLYNNIVVLSEIGQKITSVLSLEELLKTVYQNVNAMMPAAGFGIGVYNEAMQRIDFHGFMEKDGQLPFFCNELSDENRFAVWAFKNQREIFINNLQEEYHLYIKELVPILQGEDVCSLIYLPLFSENQPIGVVTVQSFQKYAYSDQHLTILKTLGSYISVAINNSHNFAKLAEAKSLIERKNTSITDSIRYAETIQHSILPGEELLSQALGEDNYFVLFKPKDIVSGDFYWCRHFENRTFIAVVDCTGHGVPGAFMSLIGNTLLNDIVSSSPETISPAELLERLHHHIRISLRQESKANDDGMDVTLCLIESPEAVSETKKVTFAGAKRPLLHLHAGGIEEIRGDRKSIGGRQKEEKRTFTNQVIDLQGNDRLYLCSDGYADQVGTGGEKYGMQRLRDLLLQCGHLGMAAQREMMLHELARHQGHAEQRDDITVVGIGV